MRESLGLLGEARLRPFGGALVDLDVDLGAPPPVATTAVLAACLGAADTEIWSWTVNRRLQGLIAVATATRGADWTSTVRCEACGALMDLPLRLDAFRRDEDPLAIALDGVEIALPTGADQKAWLEAGTDGPAAMQARLLPPSLAGREAEVEAALADADPLTVLAIETGCPECGAANALELDLEATCLALLAMEQRRLVDDVHALAAAYHWSEAEILAVPPRRRRLYLDRIAGAAP
jgi:hypothetical protein